MPDLDTAYKKIVDYAERQFGKLDKLNAKDYALALRQARAVVSDAYRKYGQKGVLTYSEMQKYGRLEKLEKMLDEAILSNTNHVAARSRKILGETTTGAFEKSAEAMGTITGSVLAKELTADQIMEILQKPVNGWSLDERMALRRKDMTIRVKGEVRRRLLQSAPVEDTWKGVKVEMEKVYAAGRTELADDFHRVSEEAIRAEAKIEVENLKKEGLYPTLTWVSAGDKDVREAHRLLDGQTIDIGEEFEVPSGEWKGHTAPAPGQFGVPALDRHCRCWVVAGFRKVD